MGAGRSKNAMNKELIPFNNPYRDFPDLKTIIFSNISISQVTNPLNEFSMYGCRFNSFCNPAAAFPFGNNLPNNFCGIPSVFNSSLLCNVKKYPVPVPVPVAFPQPVSQPYQVPVPFEVPVEVPVR
jgi:hypothetical protein